MIKRTSNDVQFMHISNLRSVPESLPADPTDGEGATDGDVQVVEPCPRPKPMLQCFVHQFGPHLLGPDVHIRTQWPTQAHIDPSLLAVSGEGSHVHRDPANTDRLASVRMPATPSVEKEILEHYSLPV